MTSQEKLMRLLRKHRFSTLTNEYGSWLESKARVANTKGGWKVMADFRKAQRLAREGRQK